MDRAAETSAETLMSRCDELSGCSSEAGRITRLYLSEPMNAAHQRLFDWSGRAGLEPRIDNAGNFIARKCSSSGDKVLLLGSHLDSVPNAGRYDGVLGTLLGIALCELMKDYPLPFHIDVLGMSEEEGVRFRRPYLGSAALVGQFEMAWLQRTDSSGMTMGEAIRCFGLDPDRIGDCGYDPSDVLGYIEPHIEQGTVLERLGQSVGVVKGIAGQSRLRLAFEGEAGHAGTSPMASRRDALIPAARFVCAVRDEALQVQGLKATVGSLGVDPNAPNVIAGKVELSLDVRHLQDELRDAAVEKLLAVGSLLATQELCDFEVLEHSSQTSVWCDRHLQATLADAVTAVNGQVVELESWAGHDAVVLGKQFPMAMLFVRHPGGISHHPGERVELADVAAAIDVLRQCILNLAAEF